jgi:hypothetical protein
MKGTFSEGAVMEIVWRNPLPPANGDNSVRRITSDDSAATYAVIESEPTEKFELIMGGLLTDS